MPRFPTGRAGHALRELGGVGEQLDRLEGMPKIGMSLDVVLEDSSLPEDLGCCGVEFLAADSKDRLFMGEGPVGSFASHGPGPTDV